MDPYEGEQLTVEALRKLTWDEMQSFVPPPDTELEDDDY